MRKLAFIVGLAVGYVLGARAGRERYEQLRKSARDFSQTPAVQKATRTAKETAGGVTGKAADTLAAKLGDQLPPSVTERVPYLKRKAAEDEGWDSAEH